MNSSKFYETAIEKINSEAVKLEVFCKALDNAPNEKKKQVVEYKRAKYRYASIARIYNLLYHGNRVYQKPAIHMDIENVIKNNAELSNLCNHAVNNEKIDFKLYYGISAIAVERIAELQKKLQSANDWEKIELEERIGGLTFAKNCLDEAWKRRKDVLA